MGGGGVPAFSQWLGRECLPSLNLELEKRGRGGGEKKGATRSRPKGILEGRRRRLSRCRRFFPILQVVIAGKGEREMRGRNSVVTLIHRRSPFEAPKGRRGKEKTSGNACVSVLEWGKRPSLTTLSYKEGKRKEKRRWLMDPMSTEKAASNGFSNVMLCSMDGKEGREKRRREGKPVTS